FRDTIAQYPGITIVAEQYSNSDRLSGLQLMEDWIARFPDLAGVYGATDDLSAGAADALEAAGLTGKVVVTGSNLSQIGRQYLAEGKIYADRKSTRLNSSHVKISYAVFCLKKK